jgi:hypothetical protein
MAALPAAGYRRCCPVIVAALILAKALSVLLGVIMAVRPAR